MGIFHKKEDVSDLINIKKENDNKVETAKEMLYKIRYELERESKEEGGRYDFEVKIIAREAGWLLKKIKDQIEDGTREGRSNTRDKILGAKESRNPKKFITDLFREPKSYSILEDIYKDLQKLEETLKTLHDVDYELRYQDPYKSTDFLSARNDLVKDLRQQEQAFINKIENATNDGHIENVVAWMTSTKLLNEYVLEPLIKNKSIDSAGIRKILDEAFQKLLYYHQPNPIDF